MYTLLQIRLTLISPRLPSLAMGMFNRPARGLLTKFHRPFMLHDNDENNHLALVKRQPHAYVDTHRNIPFLPLGSNVVMQHEDTGP